MFNSLIRRSKAYKDLAERAASLAAMDVKWRQLVEVRCEITDKLREACKVWKGRAERTMARLLEAEADVADLELGLELAEAENDQLLLRIKELMDEKTQHAKKSGKKRAKAGVAKESGKGRVPKAGGASVPKVRG